MTSGNSTNYSLKIIIACTSSDCYEDERGDVCMDPVSVFTCVCKHVKMLAIYGIRNMSLKTLVLFNREKLDLCS